MIKHQENNDLSILLVGNPNTGKSTLFNSLTGLNQHVGNFPGVTVDKKKGYFKIKNRTISVIDLPGTYSLTPTSEDERITSEYVQQSENDIIVVVADVTNLNRNLLICTQLIDLKKPVILVLNMMDLLQKNNQEIKIEQLSSLLGIPVIPINARIGKGIDELKYALDNYFFQKNSFIDQHHSPNVIDETMLRYNKISQIVNKCVIKKGEDQLTILTKKIDHILTHKVYGYFIFLTLLFIIFQAIFSWSSYPMDLIENGFIFISQFLNETLPTGVLTNLIVDGVIAGLGGIVIFVPQIAILFAFITLLVDTGYMALVSFLMDKILRQFGLNGKSIIPLLSSTACAVPSIMGARTISNYKERLITIMVAPLISCSARIPVYTLLIALIVPKESYFGIFNLQGLIMMGLYLLGFLAALLAALVMKWIIKSKEKSHFILEMPIYRLPHWSNVGLTVYNKVKVFLFDAGKIIIAVSVILWVLSSYGPNESFQLIEEKYTSKDFISNYTEQEIQTLISTEKLEASYAGVIGKTIEPLIEPIGFDWKIGIALVTSFAAREVFVGTMATLYSVGDEENTKSIKEKMLSAKDPKTGKPLYTLATTLSLLLFYAFAMQCMTTVVIVYQETNSWKWPLIQVVYMTLLAYFSSLTVFHIFS